MDFDLLACHYDAIKVPVQVVGLAKHSVQLTVASLGDEPFHDDPEVQVSFVPHSLNFSDSLEQVCNHSPVAFGSVSQIACCEGALRRVAEGIGGLQMLFGSCAAVREHADVVRAQGQSNLK